MHGPISGLIRQSAVDAAQDALAAQRSVAEAYRLLVDEANNSAQTCARALATAWDPTGRSRGGPATGAGTILLGTGGISVASLNMLRIYAEVGESIALATRINDLQRLDPTDPGLQQAISRLAAIWDGESNGVFAAAFFSGLGADRTVGIFARIATVIQPTGPTETGAITAALIGDLQADLGNGLALATSGIEYGPDGSLRDTVPGGLDAGWLTALMASGRSKITVPWNDVPIQVTGYVPVMATISQGRDFSAGVLRAFGDDMRNLELQFATDNGGAGDTVWTSTAPVRVRWDWSTGGTEFPMGNDPFTSWTAAMVGSPGAATTVLATDPDLMNHLLNERSWLLRDSGDNFGATQWLYRIVDEDEPLEGLTAFGSALPAMIGQGVLSQDSATAFDNLVRSLGDHSLNHRIDAGDFQETDWIPPELRPGVGTTLVLNADTLNTVFAVPNSVGSEAFSRLLADVAKDQGTDANGHTVIDRLMSAEYSVIAAQLLNGDFSTADLDEQARIAATFSHGQGAANIGLQQAADAAHNAGVATIAGVVQLAVDHSPAPVGWTAEAYQVFGGDLVQGLTSQFIQDTALPARNETADWTGSLVDRVMRNSTNQWFASISAQLPTPDGPDVQLLDPAGQPLAWSQLDSPSAYWALDSWPRGLDKPEQISSRTWTTFDAQVPR